MTVTYLYLAIKFCSAKVNSATSGTSRIRLEPSANFMPLLFFHIGYGRSSESLGLKKFGFIAIARQNAKASIPTITYLSAIEFTGIIVRCFIPYPNRLATNVVPIVAIFVE